MSAYYNEIDPCAAQWLRNLINAGHISAGEVDERSISDVSPDDLRGFVQCHFFAGIGAWSYALRLAGWDDSRPVWTGSCPCQPFSVAGKGDGFDDARHLWPVWHRLIEQRRPAIIFGEQVTAAIRHGWLDLVFTDMEALGYACAAASLPAAGVGAPHIRDRVWFAANCEQRDRSRGARAAGSAEPANHGGLGNPRRAGLSPCECQELSGTGRGEERRAAKQPGRSFWSDADWLPCRDGKARPVEPGTSPLAHGITNRVGRLRAYGNAIVPQVAAQFVSAFMECQP